MSQVNEQWRKHPRDDNYRGREIAAPRMLGPACVRLLDTEDGVLVLERVTPGTSAAQLPDDEATRLIARTLLDLWMPPPVEVVLARYA